MTDLFSPLRSLKEGHWFKLICGASFQHLPAIRTLALVYALAGVDCVDVAADPAIVATAREAFAIADQLSDLAHQRGYTPNKPWLMVSLNDGEDPHFRKAEFNAEKCPIECSKPCETVCPAQAIVFERPSDRYSGVIDDLCYGCGRCIPICPVQHISTRAYVYTPEIISPLLMQAGIDAIEIHTQVGRVEDFRRLWSTIAPWADQLKVLAISCPDGDGLIDYLWTLHDLISPLPCALIWQTDGRPMSGDIGDGATRACVKLGQKVLSAGLPEYTQLAGGTNRHTVPKLEALGLLQNRGNTNVSNVSKTVSGIAYGSYARSLLLPILNQLEAMEMQSLNAHTADLARSHPSVSFPMHIENSPSLLWQAVDLANQLVKQLKVS